MPRISYYDGLGRTPARVNRRTGDIQLNPRTFPFYSDLIQRYIIEHERGHFNLATRDEIEADNYAFNQIKGTCPGSVKNAVYSLTQVLHLDRPEHFRRIREALKRASYYDWKHNKNLKARELYLKLTDMNSTAEDNRNSQYEEFLGIKKGMFKRIAAGVLTGGASELARGIGKAVKKKGAKADAGTETNNPPVKELGELKIKTKAAEGDDAPEEKKILGMPKKTFYIVAGGVALVIVGIVIFFVVKKKK